MEKRRIKRKGNEGLGLRAGYRTMEVFTDLMTHLPYSHKWHPWMREDLTDMRWLPINQDIRMPENAPLPVELVDRFIEEASHRVIAAYCGCRQGFECEDYPVEIGCLLLGDSAIEIKRYGCREVGVEEAKAHLRKAVDAGLVPIVGKARADNFIYNVKDRKRLLTVCLCCECCCVTRFTGVSPLARLEPLFPRLEGISVTVTDACKACGKCVDKCYLQAIEVAGGRAVIGEYCRACGRCASACPEHAIEISIDDPEFLEKTYQRIRTYVKFD
jgi:ferredoxin